jgi:hypothetical protein
MMMEFIEGTCYTIVVQEDCIKFLMDNPHGMKRSWYLILFN